jgi:predicted O-methyltransferase YrrM
VTQQPTVIGPIFDIAYSVLKTCPEYEMFRASQMTRAEFAAFLDSVAHALVNAGLPAEDVHFAKRYPASEAEFVAGQLKRLAQCGVLPSAEYNSGWYDRLAADIRTAHYHGPFKTYIYPEEARLLFAFANVIRPREVIFLGSYYGYWAHSALATIVAHGGRAVLVDPDPRAQDVARRNLERAGLAGAVEIEITTGEEYLSKCSRQFDLVVLDAEGPRTHPDPEQRGKAIYGYLMKYALSHMPPGAYLICHNILFDDIVGCGYFDHIIARNRDELGAFLDLVGREFRQFVECSSTEGVGIGIRAD